MRFLSYLTTMLLAVTLGACGGGGGSPGLSSGSVAPTPAPPSALFTTVPAAGLTLGTGVSNSFAVGGGTPPYVVTSSNLAVASASISGSVLSIGGVGGGSASIDVRDSAGQTKSISITVTTQAVTPPITMFTTAPASVNIANGSTVTYSVTGGYTPYTVTSDDLSVVRATINGSTLSVSAVGGGKASLTIKDAGGSSTVVIAVTVGSSTKFFINAPNTVNMIPGASAVYLLNGGTAPYNVVSNDVRVVNGGIVGTALTVSALAIGSGTLQITDASGTSLTLAVTVAAPPAPPAVVVSQDPVLKGLVLRDASGLSTNSLSVSGNTLLSVTLADPGGLGIPNQVIDVTGDPTQVIFPEGSSGLTNSAGVATIKVARASLLASGAGSLTVTYSYKVGAFATYPNGSVPPAANKVITTYIGYQLSASNISLTTLDVGIGDLLAYGTRQVSVQANINGSPATTTPVQVNFTATCGQVSPASATTDRNGKVTVTYTATDAPGLPLTTSGCSNKTVTISASTVGAPVITNTIVVSTAPATNLSFVSATPSLIYLDGAGGPTQSIVVFKLVNARGEAILGQDVKLTLKTLNGGIPKASIGSVGSLDAVTVTTDSEGKISVPVFSGTVPTNVLVNAAMVSNPLVQTDSSVLAIASGRPVQDRLSLSVEKFAIQGFQADGVLTTFTISMSDRQGNPVPEGTAVNFVTSHGLMTPPVCRTVNSTCFVQFRSQGTRPANGRVVVLAYAAGEEKFTDNNLDNVYTCGEPFEDQGLAYRDDNFDGRPQVAGDPDVVPKGTLEPEFAVPRSGSPSVCGANTAPTAKVGDKVWGLADVFKNAPLVLSTDEVVILPVTPSNFVSAADPQWKNQVVTTQLNLTIQDGNKISKNSFPTGSTIVVAVTDASVNLPTDGGAPTPAIGTCTLNGQSQSSVPNSYDPLNLAIYLKNCVTGDQIRVTITTPAGPTTASYTVP